VSKGEEPTHTVTTRAANAENKSGRSKGSNMNKISMLDMKRRVTAIMDFITRTQVEMAEDPSPFKNGAAIILMQDLANGVADIIKVNGTNGEKEHLENKKEKEFKDLTCVEMMDRLTRELMKWQEEFL
jgi:hypothetical protein